MSKPKTKTVDGLYEGFPKVTYRVNGPMGTNLVTPSRQEAFNYAEKVLDGGWSAIDEITVERVWAKVKS